jgi:hypothetical protein
MSATLGRQIGEKLLRVSIAVIGLLVLRLILSALPMLKSPVVYSPSVAATPIPGDQNAITQEQIEAWKRSFATAMGQTQGVLPGDDLMLTHIAIFPLTIAYAVVDTLIFVLLAMFGRNLAFILRSNYAKFPDLGQILNFGLLTMVVAAAYYSYQGILFPFLWPSHQDLYGWAFLVLGLTPLAGVVVLVSRNMDHITGAVIRTGESAIKGPSPMQCVSCGQALTTGTKFCPSCGGTAKSVSVPPVAAGNRFCTSCGAGNPTGTKFCTDCGKPVAA